MGASGFAGSRRFAATSLRMAITNFRLRPLVTAVMGCRAVYGNNRSRPLHAELGICAKPNHYPEFDVLYLARNWLRRPYG